MFGRLEQIVHEEKLKYLDLFSLEKRGLRRVSLMSLLFHGRL